MMNAVRYIEVLTRFMKRLCRVRSQSVRQGSQCFFLDDALPHTANIVKHFIAKKMVKQIEHPSFSLDLNSPDFFLFPQLKLALIGKRFEHIPDIQRNVTKLLNSIPNEDFLQTFQNMYIRSHWCIIMEGDYFEEQLSNFHKAYQGC
ncbi:hypothetical protein TNCV_28301 [Trichonephila clavipes]|uniref:Transposase n=1 Tax=Trichonephila clavipes TaxID=2585209 RepID=A0A8X6WMW3_TRICX|nr:hypothetical protein TNCV_28301 [Trichonephila clavipes]